MFKYRRVGRRGLRDFVGPTRFSFVNVYNEKSVFDVRRQHRIINKYIVHAHYVRRTIVYHIFVKSTIYELHGKQQRTFDRRHYTRPFAGVVRLRHDEIDITVTWQKTNKKNGFRFGDYRQRVYNFRYWVSSPYFW